MFKKILIAAASLFAAMSLNASTITWSVTNWAGNVALTNRATVVTQVGDSPYSDGNRIITGPPVRFPATNGGSWSYTFAPGTFRLDIEGLSFAKAFYFVVPNDNLTWNAAALRISNSSTANIPGLLASYVPNLNGNATNLTATSLLATTTNSVLSGAPPLQISDGGFPPIGIWMSGGGLFGAAFIFTNALNSSVGLIAGNLGVYSSGPVIANGGVGNGFTGDGSGLTNLLGGVIRNISNPFEVYNSSNGVVAFSIAANKFAQFNGNADFTGFVEVRGLTLDAGLTISTTGSPPSNTTTPAAWFTVTHTNGASYRIPLYQ